MTLSTTNQNHTAHNSSKKTNAIGLLGGTFDPIHLGHIIPAEHLAKVLNLSFVNLLPAHIPPHKHATTASAEQRLAMVRLICQHHPIFQLDERELKRTTKSYTIDSIKELKAEQPQTTICFFIGTDSLLTLPSWYQIEQLLELCHFVVSRRPGYELPALDDDFYANRLTNSVDELTTKQSGKILLVDTPQVDISSTQLRKMLQRGQNCKDYLPPEVQKYIKQQGLYN